MTNPFAAVGAAEAALKEATIDEAANSNLLAQAQKDLDAAKAAGEATAITAAQSKVDMLAELLTQNQAAAATATTNLNAANAELANKKAAFFKMAQDTLAAAVAAGAPADMVAPLKEALAANAGN